MIKERCHACGKTKGTDWAEVWTIVFIWAFLLAVISSAVKYVFNL